MLAQSKCSIAHHGDMPKTHVAAPTGPHRDFALRFRRACEYANAPSTLRELKKILKVSEPTIHDWRHGNKYPSSEKMSEIAVKLGVNYDWLATGRGTIERPVSSRSSQFARRFERASPDVQAYIEALLSVSESKQEHDLQ